jgi:small subunit ribosomal protein S6
MFVHASAGNRFQKGSARSESWMSTAAVEKQTQVENLYEGMFLLDSGKFAADSDGLTKQVLGILEKAGATIVAHRPWQDGKLAYAIEGQRRGLHFLVYFRMPGGGMPEVVRACRLNDSVLRHLIIKHPQMLFDAMVQALESGGPVYEAAEEVVEEEPRRRRRDVEEMPDEDLEDR